MVKKIADKQPSETLFCRMCGKQLGPPDEGGKRPAASQADGCDLCSQCSESEFLPGQLLKALTSLNQISAVINNIGSGNSTGMEETLRLIVESAIKVVQGSSAVIYTYDQAGSVFDPSSRVSAGELAPPDPFDEPRSNGMGNRAIERRRCILSNEEHDLEIHPIKVEAGARVVACYPLVVAEQIVGVLYIYLHQERHFDQLELLMFDNFVNQAAMAIYHARRVASVQRDLTRKEEEITRLHRAGLLISSRLGLRETLETILQMALEVTDAKYGSFRLVDDEEENLILAAIAGEELNHLGEDSRPINANSVMGWVAQNRQPLCIPDVRDEPWASIYRPLDLDLEIRSELAVPLIGASGRLEGVLNLESTETSAFSKPDSHLLQALATQAVIAIQETLLLDALREITERLLIEPYQQVLTRLTELACDLLNAAAGAVWMVEGDDLIVQAANNSLLQGERVPLHNSLIGQAVLQRKPVTSDDLRTDASHSHPEQARAQGWRRALIVPLLASTSKQLDPIGAISVYSVEPAPGNFSESDWDKKVLTILAHYACLVVQNSSRQEALRAAQDQQMVTETFATLGDVAVNLLHQLNNKFGTIPVRVQGIQEKCAEALQADPYLAANLAEIEDRARESMAVFRENLTLFNPVKPVPIRLETCVRKAVEKTNLPQGVGLQTEGLENLLPIVAGEQSLELVFINLLENAANALGDKGVITVTGSMHNDWVEVSVSDTGPGIEPELHKRIFELSYSGKNSTHGGKLGLGLWWVKMLMVRLGGSVTVQSDGRQGTTFLLKFPSGQGPPSTRI